MGIKHNVKKRLTAVLKISVILLVLFIILLPLYWIFISSITPATELFKSPIDYLPDHPTLDSYIFLFQNVRLLEKIRDTVLIVGAMIIISTTVCVFGAYAFARFHFRGISLVFGFILATMLVPDVVLARPLYIFMQKVGLFDTRPGLTVLYISAVIPFTTLVLRNFVGEIPYELEEAASIDGASFLQRIFYVVVPLMKPAIATVCIINFISGLNNFFIPLFYAQNIQVLSTTIIKLPSMNNLSYDLPWELVSATAWIILLPIILFVAVFEKQIMEGIMAGGVKT